MARAIAESRDIQVRMNLKAKRNPTPKAIERPTRRREQVVCIGGRNWGRRDLHWLFIRGGEISSLIVTD
jgi:hypothetical protein